MPPPFTSNDGKFEFPDTLFPEIVTTAQVPDSPAAIASRLQAESRRLRSVSGGTTDLRAAVAWSQQVIHFHSVIGQIPPDAIEQAISFLRQAAASGSVYAGEAAYHIGSIYGRGLLDQTPDPLEEKLAYRAALKRGYARGWFRIAVNAESRGETATALSRFQRGLDKNDAACKYRISAAHLYDYDILGLDRDERRGLQLLQEAADTCDDDYPLPAYVYGRYLLGEAGSSYPTPKMPMGLTEKQRGMNYIIKAARFGLRPALLRLSESFQTQSGILPFDPLAALRCLHLATREEAYAVYCGGARALGGEPETLVVKWLLCGYKDIIKPNEVWAYKFAQCAAELHNGTALFALGYFCEVGLGGAPHDKNLALEWYRKSAQQKCQAAQERLRQLESPARHSSLRRSLTRQDHARTLKQHSAAVLSGSSATDPRLLAIQIIDESNGDQIEGAPSKAPVSLRDGSPAAEPPGPMFKPSPADLPYPTSPELTPLSSSSSTLPYPSSPEAAPGGSKSTSSLPYPDSPQGSVEKLSLKSTPPQSAMPAWRPISHPSDVSLSGPKRVATMPNQGPIASRNPSSLVSTPPLAPIRSQTQLDLLASQPSSRKSSASRKPVPRQQSTSQPSQQNSLRKAEIPDNSGTGFPPQPAEEVQPGLATQPSRQASPLHSTAPASWAPAQSPRQPFQGEPEESKTAGTTQASLFNEPNRAVSTYHRATPPSSMWKSTDEPSLQRATGSRSPSPTGRASPGHRKAVSMVSRLPPPIPSTGADTAIALPSTGADTAIALSSTIPPLPPSLPQELPQGPSLVPLKSQPQSIEDQTSQPSQQPWLAPRLSPTRRIFTSGPIGALLRRSPSPKRHTRMQSTPAAQLESLDLGSASSSPESSPRSSPRIRDSRGDSASMSSASRTSVSPSRDRMPSMNPAHRKPGVAYTFEDMGIKTTTTDKNGTCVIS